MAKIKFDGDWIAAVGIGECFVITSSRGDFDGEFGTKLEALSAGARRMWGVSADEAPNFVKWHCRNTGCKWGSDAREVSE